MADPAASSMPAEADTEDTGGPLYFDSSAGGSKRRAAAAKTKPLYDPRDPLAVLEAPPPPDTSRPAKRRRQQQQQQQQQQGGGGGAASDQQQQHEQHEQHELLQLTGHACDVQQNDQLAGWLHGEGHLQGWMGDAALLLDRYDARLLLEDASAIKKLKAFANKEDPTEAGELRQQLDAERYRDLLVDHEGAEKQDSEQAAGASSGAAIGFAYGAAGAAAAAAAAAPAPPDEKTREIISRTVSFVCSQPAGAAKAIDVLKFKNVQNRTFDFLLHDHPHHAYFRSAVDEEQERLRQQQEKDEKEASALPGLAGYGSGAGSSDDESEEEDEAASAAAAAHPLGCPVTAATLAKVKPPGEVTAPRDATVLAMLAKLLEYRRTFAGESWADFLASLQKQEAVRAGPDRFSFLLTDDAHHSFWLWAVKAVKAVT